MCPLSTNLRDSSRNYQVLPHWCPKNFPEAPKHGVLRPETSAISRHAGLPPISQGKRCDLIQFYTYTKIVSREEFNSLLSSGAPLPPVEGVDGPGFNEGALARYGPWRILSLGPDQVYSQPGIPIGPFNPNGTLFGADIPYDPSNGTVSFGNILRTQKDAEGAAPQY